MDWALTLGWVRLSLAFRTTKMPRRKQHVTLFWTENTVLTVIIIVCWQIASCNWAVVLVGLASFYVGANVGRLEQHIVTKARQNFARRRCFWAKLSRNSCMLQWLEGVYLHRKHPGVRGCRYRHYAKYNTEGINGKRVFTVRVIICTTFGRCQRRQATCCRRHFTGPHRRTNQLPLGAEHQGC